MPHKYFGSILAGKRALITGANRGLGLLMAHRFLECGAKVAIFCAPHEEIEPAVAELKAINPAFEVLGFKPNLTDEDALRKIMAEIEDKWGGLDILVNNAGLYPPKAFEEYPQDLFKTVFDVNVTGMFVTSKIATELLKKNPAGGVILNTSSMAGINGAMANIGYTSSKFAVEGLTLGMARELGEYNIRVNAVAPAGMEKTDVNGNIIPMDTSAYANMPQETITKLQKATETALKFAPMGKFNCHPDEMINAFIFLASDAAAFISGQTIAVSGACIWPAASPASSMN